MTSSRDDSIYIKVNDVMLGEVKVEIMHNCIVYISWQAEEVFKHPPVPEEFKEEFKDKPTTYTMQVTRAFAFDPKDFVKVVEAYNTQYQRIQDGKE